MRTLGSPSPRRVIKDYQPIDWPETGELILLEPAEASMPPLDRVISNRRSQRKFEHVTFDRLSAFLHWTCRTNSTQVASNSILQKQKALVSAGAIHPIHTLLWNQKMDWCRYDDLRHTLFSIPKSDNVNLLIQAAEDCLNLGNGTLISFVAEPGLSDALYKKADSLIWRDCGVLIGHMSIVAEALNLNFCPLGITGEPYVGRLDPRGRLAGVGLAVIGEKPSINAS